MCVNILADLPDRSIATISTYTTKLDRFDKIRTHGKSTCTFENEFLGMVFQLLEEILFINEIGASIFRVTTVKEEKLRKRKATRSAKY